MRRPLRAGGFSLIELLVSMAIALVVTLAITSVMIRTGAERRTSSAINDTNETGTYLSFMLDRLLRSAGSGYMQNWTDVAGCRLNVARDGTAILPRTSAFSVNSAFANASQTVRLIPVLIGKNAADTALHTRGDLLTVIGGTGGFGELGQDVRTASVTSTSIGLQNTVAWRTGDLVLLADPSLGAGCMVQQVSAKASDSLTLGGTYANATGTNINMTDFTTSSSSVAVQLGGSPDNLPTMQMVGVGANATLFSHDLLRPTGTDVDVPVADGVVEMRAVYGLDTTSPPDGVLDSWLNPTTGSGYAAADLTDGSAAAQAKLRRIVAVRVGLILRSALEERDDIAASASATLFSDIGLTRTRTFSGTELKYRYRTIEVTVPLRNTIFAPAS